MRCQLSGSGPAGAGDLGTDLEAGADGKDLGVSRNRLLMMNINLSIWSRKTRSRVSISFRKACSRVFAGDENEKRIQVVGVSNRLICLALFEAYRYTTKLLTKDIQILPCAIA